MNSINRRRFVRSLGLGAGALALSPIANQLLHAAEGTEPKVKRLVILLNGNGMNFGRFTPPGTSKSDGSLTERTSFELPPMYEALAPYQERMLLIDGLPNRNNGGHYSEYAALSCVGGSQPRAETFDQFVARRVGGSTPFTSLTLGTAKDKATRSYTGAVAFGPGKPTPIQTSPAAAYERIFGLAAGGEKAKQFFSARYRLLDHIRGDVTRVRARLVGQEKLKFDQYLQSLETMEERLQRLQSFDLPSGCGTPGPVMASADKIEDRAMQMFELGKAALSCGLTNVLTICNGTSAAQWDFPKGILGMPEGFHTMGHGGGGGPATYDTWLNYHAGMLKDLMDHLDSFPEGDGTMLDNTLILWTNENGEQHHSRLFRWPFMILGNGGGVLKADGRYVRYPVIRQKDKADRSLSEVYNTLSRVFGAPVDDWGKLGAEPTNGPLPELMT